MTKYPPQQIAKYIVSMVETLDPSHRASIIPMTESDLCVLKQINRALDEHNLLIFPCEEHENAATVACVDKRLLVDILDGEGSDDAIEALLTLADPQIVEALLGEDNE